MRSFVRRSTLALSLLAAASPAGAAPGYDKPPQAVLDVMRAPSPPVPYVSPTREKILLVSRVEYPPMSRVAEPFLKLAGVRVEPRTRRRHDTPGGYGITACARDLTLVEVASGTETKVPLPAGGCADDPDWSADGKRFIFASTAADGVELWVGDAATGQVRRIEGVRLNPMLGEASQWMPDQKSVIVKLVPPGAGSPPAAPAVPLGPSIQETEGEQGESSTYETRDTLQDKHDEDLFDYFAASQLAIVDVTSGAVTRLGEPAILDTIDVAPDGQHLLVETIHRPYSYVTTYDRFPREVEIWDRSGKKLHTVASLPLADRVPIHGVPTGPRDFAWRATAPATLVWAEALDGGDWNVTVPARDKIMIQSAPFTAAPAELTRTQQRFGGVSWGERPSFGLLRDYDANKHWMRTFIINVDDRRARPGLLWDLSTDEKYKHPGNPSMRQLANGYYVVLQNGESIYLQGRGASTEGDRPFLDRLDLRTRKAERLWRSDKTAYETVLAIVSVSDRGPTFLTWHQTVTAPPNAFLRTVTGAAARAAAGEAAFVTTTRPVTHIPDPTPAVRAIKKTLVTYKRKDGMDLSFTLYTPPDYREGTRVPAILYAYPRDYADPTKAGQVSGSERTFTRLKDYRLLLMAGYAIIDNAAFPIVGDPKRAYDTYLEQLVADATAAVDKAVDMGVVDRERVGVTGHSHGALMTVNLLAHSSLFRAGVATSGSYNKTLTPFGFQSERRSVWDAQSVYLEASPFFFVDKLKLPLLIMHGEDDANPGTTPLQAIKLYEAIRGNGGTARLVMLPHEPHWYTARESNEHEIAEMIRWFDRYVKNVAPRAQTDAKTPRPN